MGKDLYGDDDDDAAAAPAPKKAPPPPKVGTWPSPNFGPAQAPAPKTAPAPPPPGSAAPAKKSGGGDLYGDDPDDARVPAPAHGCRCSYAAA